MSKIVLSVTAANGTRWRVPITTGGAGSVGTFRDEVKNRNIVDADADYFLSSKGARLFDQDDILEVVEDSQVEVVLKKAAPPGPSQAVCASASGQEKRRTVSGASGGAEGGSTKRRRRRKLLPAPLAASVDPSGTCCAA